MQKKQSDWEPLESNPEVINTFAKKLGLCTEQFSFQELLSRQEWALQMISKPVLGVILCFEDTPIQSQFKENQQKSLKLEEVPKNLFFMKQYAANACGTIALFHIIMNKMKQKKQLVKQDCYFKQFQGKTKSLDPQKIGQIFKQSKDLQQQHKQAVHQGESQIPCSINSHFIAFIQWQGYLYELDGCKKCPVNHGQCQQDKFLENAAIQIGRFMDRDPDNISFSMIVLAKNSQSQ